MERADDTLPRDVTIERATPGDADVVLGILHEAARWLLSRGIDQWRPDQFERESLLAAFARGELYLAKRGDEAVGTLSSTGEHLSPHRCRDEDQDADTGWVTSRLPACDAGYSALEEIWYTSSMPNERESHKIALNIPRETWEAVNELAREHQRSFTKELVWALQAYVRRERKRKRERQ